MTLEGLEVLLLQPDFATAPKLVGNQKVSSANLGESAKVNAYTGDRPLHAFTHRFKFVRRSDAAILEDFVTDRAGSWKPFWLPSWHGELNPVATIPNGTTFLSITPVNYATVYDPTHANVTRLGHYIFLIHYDGTVLIRKVVAVIGTNPEVLVLDSAVTREFALGNFAVGFVYCVALIADKLTLNFSGLENISTELAVAEETAIDEPDSTSDNPDINDLLVADFETDVASGDPPLTVEFTDTSTGNPVAWLWQFGDGTANSTSQNPTHEFTESGNYSVRLRVTDANGSTSSITKTIVVNAEAIPPEETLEADFSFTPAGGDAVLAVTFTDESLGTPTVWTWTFGDGSSQSGEQNPSHSYALPGIYTITLLVRDTNGATSTKVDTITVTEAAAIPVTCDSGASYDGPSTSGLSCSSCCTYIDAMAIDDIAIWVHSALENCLGLTVTDGMNFEFNGKSYAVAYDSVFNDGGSFNSNGVYFYDVVRTA